MKDFAFPAADAPVESAPQPGPRQTSRTAKVLILSSGEALIALVALISMAVLTRVFDKLAYGTYRQTLLAYYFAVPFVTLGLDRALYYFLPGEEKRPRALLVENLLLLTAAGGVLSLFLLLGGDQLLARRFNNPGLAPLLRLMIPYPLLMLPASALSACLMARNRTEQVAGFNVASRLVMLCMILLPVLLWPTPRAAILGTVAGSVLTTAVALWFMFQACPSGPWRPTWGGMRAQLDFGIPLGLGTLVGAMSQNLDQMMVSLRCRPDVFAVYSVGAFEIPLIGIITGSITSVVMVDYTRLHREGRSEEMLALMHQAMRKSAMLLLPMMVLLLCVAPDLMCFAFGERYAGSAVPFRVFLLLLPVRTFTFWAVLQSTGQNRSILISSILTLACNVALGWWAIGWLGPVGASWASVISIYLCFVPYVMHQICTTLKVPCRALLPWGDIGRLFAACLLPGAAAYGVLALAPRPHLVRLLLGSAAYLGVLIMVLPRVGCAGVDEALDQAWAWWRKVGGVPARTWKTLRGSRPETPPAERCDAEGGRDLRAAMSSRGPTQTMAARELRPEVYLARCAPPYDRGLGENSSMPKVLGSLWTAMGLDRDDPFRGWLAPGGLAVLKPNWVLDRNLAGGGLDCVITHRSLIYWTAFYCARAMQGRGRIIIGDAPIQGCDFPALARQARLDELSTALSRAFPGLSVQIEDWRLTGLDRAADLADYRLLDAGAESFLEDISDRADRFRVTMYRPSALQEHHRPGTHRYLLRREPLEADLLINLAKWKTHQKAGLTGALKNLVGLNGHKSFLPHHMKGAYAAGGDSYCDANRFAAWAEDIYDRWWEGRSELAAMRDWLFYTAYASCRLASRFSGGDGISPGSWSGNETIWRMTLDLNHLVYFGPHRPKRILNIVDGVIAGEGDGPLRATPKSAGVIVAGENPAFIDAVLCRMMGYNPHRIATVFHAMTDRRSKFGGPGFEQIPVRLAADAGGAAPLLWRDLPAFGFRPPPHWERAACEL